MPPVSFCTSPQVRSMEPGNPSRHFHWFVVPRRGHVFLAKTTGRATHVGHRLQLRGQTGPLGLSLPALIESFPEPVAI
jgi:hypothetical protein